MSLRRVTFGRGIYNRTTPESLPDGFVEVATDIDFSDVGDAASRRGVQLLIAGLDGDALTAFRGQLVASIEGRLEMIDPTRLTRRVLQEPIRRGPVAFAHSAQWLFWSTRTEIGRIQNGVSHLIAPRPPVVALVTPQQRGDLSPGKYRVALSGIDATGVEGELGYDTVVDVPSSASGLAVALGAEQPSELALVAVYVSPTNSGTLYRYGVFPAASPRLAVTRSAHLTPCPVEDRYAMSPGLCLGFRNGVLLSASGSVVRYSEPFQPMLAHPEQMWLFESDVRVIAPADDGWFIGTAENHWFISYDDSGAARRRRAAGYGAPRQNPAFTADSAAPPIWMTDQGLVQGQPGGALREVTRDAITVGEHAQAAVAYRESQGIRQFLASCF